MASWPVAKTATRTARPVPCGSSVAPRTIWSPRRGSIPRLSARSTVSSNRARRPAWRRSEGTQSKVNGSADETLSYLRRTHHICHLLSMPRTQTCNKETRILHLRTQAQSHLDQCNGLLQGHRCQKLLSLRQDKRGEGEPVQGPESRWLGSGARGARRAGCGSNRFLQEGAELTGQCMRLSVLRMRGDPSQARCDGPTPHRAECMAEPARGEGQTTRGAQHRHNDTSTEAMQP